MQDKEHEWQSNQDATERDDEAEQLQVPSTLLSNVLQRLELLPEQASSELSPDDLLLKLRSGRWEERVQALCTLEKMEYTISIELLAPFLKDEDEAVRAAAIHMLGTMGQQVPLSWLVEAVHDMHWQVRETAIFALAKQGHRIPIEVLMTALHDGDGSVREAASFVLQQSPVDETSSALYGQLREETFMQRDLYDPARLNGKHSFQSSENGTNDGWNGAFVEYGSFARSHEVSEQVQAYAAGQYTLHDATSYEAPTDEYAEMMSSRNEKVTSYRLRRKSHKVRWAIILITALLFFVLGCLSATVVRQTNFEASPKDIQNVSPSKLADFPFNTSAYASIMQNALSNALHLTHPEIMMQLKRYGSLRAVAENQGVSASQLQEIEMNAFNSIFNQAVSMKDIDPQVANSWINRLQSNPALREKIVLELLTSAPQ